MDVISVGWIEINSEPVQTVPFLKVEPLNEANAVALPSIGHIPTEQEVALLAGVGIGVVEDRGAVLVGIPIWTDDFAAIRKESGSEQGRGRPGTSLARMPDV